MSSKITENSSCKVNIFNDEYKIVGNDSNDYIQELAKLVDKKMNDLSQNLPNLPKFKIAVLAALNLADEIKTLEKKRNSIDKEHYFLLKERTKNLISMIDKNLVGDIY